MVIKHFTIFLLICTIISFNNAKAFDDAGHYKQYPFKQITLSENDSDQIMLLLKACADIMDYDCRDYDIHKLTKYILYTKNNFKILGYTPVHEDQNNTMLKFCDREFVDNVLYNIFRLTPEQPSADSLLEYSYYYSDGLYYYSGKFDTYFATDVLGISEIYRLSDDTFYIIFYNTYVEGDSPIQFEYSSAVVSYDNIGFFLKRLNMNSEPLSADELYEYTDQNISYKLSELRIYMPAIIILSGLAIIIFITYKYLL